jgi:hypothetical protein
MPLELQELMAAFKTNTSMRSIELYNALGHSISKTEINSNGQTSAEIATDQLANGA